MSVLRSLLHWPAAVLGALGRGILRLLGFQRARGDLTGEEYEAYVASYLRTQGYHHIALTRRTGDYGVDLVAKHAGVRYAVQCKYYSGLVDGSAVQEAVAGMACYGCTRAMVVTNSRLTAAARRLAQANGVDVLEEVRPGRIALTDCITFGRLLAFAAGCVASAMLLPQLHLAGATFAGTYAAAGLACFALPALLVWLAGRVRSALYRRF